MSECHAYAHVSYTDGYSMLCKRQVRSCLGEPTLLLCTQMFQKGNIILSYMYTLHIMYMYMYNPKVFLHQLFYIQTVHVHVSHIKATYYLVPRPHPLRGEGSGDIGAISWSCTPSRDSIELNVLSHMNAELAQPRNRSNVTRPFSSQRVGSGDETTYYHAQGMDTCTCI